MAIVTTGRLTALERIPGVNGKPARYRCRCACGNETSIAIGDFKKGLVKSCGCWKAERMGALRRTHNKTDSPEYRVWHAMKNRCSNQRSAEFRHYGGRGITVCQRWLDSFESFLADMGPRPSMRYTIDRTDNNRGYEPDNCQWRTGYAQARNRRSTRILTAFGKSQCVSDWADEYGVRIATLFARLRKGLSLEAALTIPLNDYRALRAHR